MDPQGFAEMTPLRSIPHQATEFRPNRATGGGVMIDSILAVTSTNLDNFLHFLAQIILRVRVTEKL